MVRRKKSDSLSPYGDPLSIGNLIISAGHLSQEDFDKLLTEFQELDQCELLGKFLVCKDVLTQEQLEMLLIRQDVGRNGRVDHSQVMRALKVAERTQDRVDVEVSYLQGVLAKGAK